MVNGEMLSGKQGCNADDFAAVLTKSLSKAEALLNAANYYPVGMITGFAEKAQEDVRAMFIALF